MNRPTPSIISQELVQKSNEVLNLQTQSTPTENLVKKIKKVAMIDSRIGDVIEIEHGSIPGRVRYLVAVPINILEPGEIFFSSSSQGTYLAGTIQVKAIETMKVYAYTDYQEEGLALPPRFQIKPPRASRKKPEPIVEIKKKANTFRKQTAKATDRKKAVDEIQPILQEQALKELTSKVKRKK